MQLFFDTETTGVPKVYGLPVSNVDNYPRLVQLGFIVYNGREPLLEKEYIIRPVGFEIPVEVSDIHGVTQKIAESEGVNIESVLEDFLFWIENCDEIVGHNVDFDVSVVGAEYWRLYQKNPFEGKKVVCTMKSTTRFVGVPRSGGFKYPKLHELYRKLFNEDMGAAHTALQDISNTAKCYFALVERGIL